MQEVKPPQEADAFIGGRQETLTFVFQNKILVIFSFSPAFLVFFCLSSREMTNMQDVSYEERLKYSVPRFAFSEV